MTAERGQAMASHANRKRNGMAFGVDPTRKQFYSLRQARYDRLGEQVAELGHQLLKEKGRKADVLDIGPWDGVMLRHLEGHGGLEAVNYSAADLALYEGFYGKAHIKRFFPGNLMDGYPEIESEAYDVVVCEQVLEHLSETPNAIKTLERAAAGRHADCRRADLHAAAAPDPPLGPTALGPDFPARQGARPSAELFGSVHQGTVRGADIA